MKGRKGKCGPAWIAWVLVVIGALNWGLVGLGGFLGGNWNVVNLLLGSWPAVEYIVYILVGIAGVVALFGCKCKTCRTKGEGMRQEQQSGQPQGGQQM